MPKKTSRRQRRHGHLPAGFQWRDGRPRWVPSPARRREGWRGADLKDAWGAWLPEGKAIERAREIALAVAARAATGAPVAPAFLAFAPKGAAAGGVAKGAEGPRSIGALADAFLADPKPVTRLLGDKTRADYRSKLKRLLEVMAAELKISVAALRAVDVDLLLAPPFGSDKPFLLSNAYDTLFTDAGHHMAHGCLAVASVWLNWAKRKKRALPANPAEDVARATPPGRIVVFDWAELGAIVAAAEELGLPSVADAFILAIDLSWSEQDILALSETQISADFHVRHRRIKTGVAGNPQLLAIGQARLAQIRERWRGSNTRPLSLIVCERTGEAWKQSEFIHVARDVLTRAADLCPALAAKQFRDTRDTSITYGHDAGLSAAEICTRSLHTPTRCEAVLAKHYSFFGQALTDGAAAKLDAHYAKMGYTFETLPVLPARKG